MGMKDWAQHRAEKIVKEEHVAWIAGENELIELIATALREAYEKGLKKSPIIT